MMARRLNRGGADLPLSRATASNRQLRGKRAGSDAVSTNDVFQWWAVLMCFAALALLTMGSAAATERPPYEERVARIKAGLGFELYDSRISMWGRNHPIYWLDNETLLFAGTGPKKLRTAADYRGLYPRLFLWTLGTPARHYSAPPPLRRPSRASATAPRRERSDTGALTITSTRTPIWSGGEPTSADPVTSSQI